MSKSASVARIVIGGAAAVAAIASTSSAGSTAKPNILVIVLDDIGIDQTGIEPFGWNQSDLVPEMPVLQAIADRSVSFTNFWATPECSPSRAAMLTGRYGFRTGVVTAIIDPMLPVDQLNPAEITLPKLLGPAGYRTAMIGKYHMGGGPSNTPPGYSYESPAASAGLDFYDGYWDLPPSIDTTLGGQSSLGTWTCGGIGGAGVVGAACFPDGSCIEGVPPFQAMAAGATPLLNADGTLAETCADGDCGAIDYTKTNAYYAWDRVTTFADGSYVKPADPEREYLTDFVKRRSIEWIEDPKATSPWLAFVTHSASHTPIQPPPPSLSAEGRDPPDCSVGSPVGDYRLQFKRMSEAVDRSVGEMLVELGLAKIVEGTFELIDPSKTNTMIVVFADNGSLGSTVLEPFDGKYAKQTVYQTGVWTACMIAGPMVVDAGRAVSHMTSVVDLFGLIADVAGVDWKAQIPSYRIVDSMPMLPYLTDPDAPPQREFDYALYETGTFAAGQVGPCIIGGFVVDGIITTPALCNDNGGCWAGGSANPPYRTTDYCDLLKAGSIECGGTTYCFPADNPFCDPSKPTCTDGTCGIPPTIGQWAIRSGEWKLIVLQYPPCLAPNDCQLEFYRMPTPVPPHDPSLDTPGSSTQIDTSSMSPDEEAMYEQLRAQLFETLSTQWYCPGDGNKDFKVDDADLDGLLGSWGYPGFWDCNEDGVTDGKDLAIVLGNWNPDCFGQTNADAQNIPPCLAP